MPGKCARAVAAPWLAAAVLACPAQAQPRGELADLSLEELAQIEVTSVSRRAESLRDAAASIYVITADDIRRSTARTLAEALRLAPNLHVARVDAGQYAISARGFNNTVANKLLVMVDGRTIYTPLFSGVFWEQQDLMLEDIERIEVISGPGATLWGANAVNGVINVITRPARQTQGVLASAAGGNTERDAALRFGGELPGGHYRVYAKAREQQNARFAAGAPAALFGSGRPRSDGREHAQMGFRADWASSADRFTLQGDVYESVGDDPGTTFGASFGAHEGRGANLLGRWSRDLGAGEEVRVQAYLDHSSREDRVLFQPTADIFDLEVQHGLPLGRHRLLWGAGSRYGRDRVTDVVFSGMRPRSSELSWANAFVQGELRLSETVELIPGIKVERNEYSGEDLLPSVRLAWKPAPERLVWAAASRAARAPSRLDRDVVFPLPFPPPLDAINVGGKSFDSEIADVYELGYRAQAGRSFTYSATLFRHEWDRLRSARIVGLPLTPFELNNQIEGTVYGLEGWASWRVTPAWQLSGGFFVLRKDLRLEPGSTDTTGPDNITLGADPEHQWSLRSAWNLGERQQLDVYVRHVGRIPIAREGVAGIVPAQPSHTGLDLRYAWQVSADTEISLTVQNLQERWHHQFQATGTQPPTEVERSVFLALRWSP